jgi:hypothetical protein
VELNQQITKDIAAEILKQAQLFVQAQIAASSAIDSKLTSLFSQGCGFALALFGSAALPFGKGAWLPVWSSFGFATAGIFATTGAFLALWGLRCSEWAAPGLRPSKTAYPEIIYGQPEDAFFKLAWAYDDAASENDKNLARAEKWHRRTLIALALSPTCGILAALLAWCFLQGWWWVLTIVFTLLFGVTTFSKIVR